MTDQPDVTGSAAHRQVGFKEAIQLGIRNYILFTGRSSRGAYWYWALGIIILSIIASVLDLIVTGGASSRSGSGPLSALLSLATLLPGLGLAFRRMHDVGKSAWWLLIGLVPFVGWIYLIYLACQPGERKTNPFGPDVEAGRLSPVAPDSGAAA